MTAYYNEIDPYAAQWLRNLIAAGHIAPGDVDERSIEDVHPDDLRKYTQCHFFAGVGVWSLALRRAGWDDDRPVWTGSCPCQPFSAAGQGNGFADERHLWPSFAWLILQCNPGVVFGEQVASKDAEPWLDLVQADLEAMDYAFGTLAFPSAGVGAPHIRDRTYWVANANCNGRQPRRQGREALGHRAPTEPDSRIVRLDHANHARLEGHTGYGRAAGRQGSQRSAAETGLSGGLADSNGGNPGAEREQCGWQQRQQPENGRAVQLTTTSPVNGLWADADWLFCRDGKWRPVEPGTFPLAHGAPSRVGRLRAYGNAINAEAATQFIAAYLEIPDMVYLTPYNPDHPQRLCTGPSVDSGFSNLDEVRGMMGEPMHVGRGYLLYPGGTCFSTMQLSSELTQPSPMCNDAAITDTST